jgi:LAO/AO transport system kinase
LINISNTRTLNQKDIINNILRGDTVSLSRAITLVESKKNSDRKLANNLLKECLSKNKKTSIRIGIT